MEGKPWKPPLSPPLEGGEVTTWDERQKRSVSWENDPGGRGESFEKKKKVLSTLKNWGRTERVKRDFIKV